MDDSLRLRMQNTRNEIASGALRGPAFRELLLSIPARDRDAWVDALFGFEDPPPDIPDLPRGAVPYLPCGVEEILRAIDDAPVCAQDELVDLGAGLGRVAILAHLLTGARAHGIEIQQPLVMAANACRDALALSDVTFEHANVVDVVLSGSIFFLYAPFNGEILKAVLRRVEDIARERPIVVCAVGLELRDVKWLAQRSTKSVSLAIYDSTSSGVIATGRKSVSAGC